MDIDQKYAQAFGITYRIGDSDICLINNIQDILSLAGQNAVFALQIICYPSKNEFKQCQPSFVKILQEQIHARMLANALSANYEQLLILASIECVILFSKDKQKFTYKQKQKIVETHLNIIFPHVQRKNSQTKSIIDDISESWEDSNDIIVENQHIPEYQYINYCINHQIFNALLLEFELNQNIIGFNTTDFYVMNQQYNIQFQSQIQKVKLLQDDNVINIIGNDDKLQLPCTFKTQVISFFNKIKIERFHYADVKHEQRSNFSCQDDEEGYLLSNLSSISQNLSNKKESNQIENHSKLRMCQSYEQIDFESSSLSL